ncbi:acyl-CoA dehydrogenase/hypothetical protein [Piscibacillus halophilus]|uniref:Acyl-CoA dehydrogenase/oxidase N-terminal domain-containing protein n=1 Tax=Piscibacillus halophilus TaxID=571933 RepID=A0A1H9E6A1_9BACI|nr:acyl-CoA dehydrogenase family protein [Piscibacillus halophilus]SEQ21254.1 acyl-CoA dehydrogenase/hypothetical protein [Piscibacillus halophilus]
MNLNFTDEQNMMRKMVRDFAQQEVAPAVERMEAEDRFPVELIEKMGELGILGIPIPEEHGGAGMDYVSYIIAIHECVPGMGYNLVVKVHYRPGSRNC